MPGHRDLTLQERMRLITQVTDFRATRMDPLTVITRPLKADHEAPKEAQKTMQDIRQLLQEVRKTRMIGRSPKKFKSTNLSPAHLSPTQSRLAEMELKPPQRRNRQSPIEQTQTERRAVVYPTLDEARNQLNELRKSPTVSSPS